MKHNTKIILPILFSLACSSMSFAADETTAEQKQPPMKGMGCGMGMGMGMMGNMTKEQKEQHMRSMQAHMLAIHDLSNQILAEKNPTLKEKLMNQQLKLIELHHQKMMGMMTAPSKPEK